MSYRKSAIYNIIAVFLSLGFRWLLSILVVRWGDFQQAGILAIAFSYANIFLPFATYSTRNLVLADVKYEYSDSEFIMFRIFTIVLSFGGCIVFSIISKYDTSQRAIIIMYYIYIMSEAVEDILFGLYQRDNKLETVAKIAIGRSICFFLFFVVTFKLLSDVVLSVGMMAIASWIYVVFVECRHYRSIHKFERIVDKGTVIKKLLINGTPIMINVLLVNWQSSFPRLIFQRIRNITDLGIYSSLANVTLLLSTGATCIFTPFIPKYSVYFLDRQINKLVKLILQIISLVMLCSFFSYILIQIIGEWGLSLLLRKNMQQYMASFYYLFYSIILYIFQVFLTDLIVGIREQRKLVYSGVIGFSLTIAMTIPCCKAYGMDGITFSMMSGYIVQIIFMIFVLIKKVRSIMK